MIEPHCHGSKPKSGMSPGAIDTQQFLYLPGCPAQPGCEA